MTETTAGNGVHVICEKIPFFRSVSFGIWIDAGSRDEPAEKAGLFHFLEHLVFKGTSGRDAQQIAMEIDALGGQIDAFTSRELTCYSGRVIGDRLEQAFDLVADIMLNATFPDDEIERERQVILEEIRMGEDNPSDFIHDKLYTTRWGSHPLGRPITGDSDTVNSITRDDLVEARDRFYRPPRIIISACGDIDPQKLLELANNYFGNLELRAFERKLINPQTTCAMNIYIKPLEQEHALLCGSGLPVAHPRRNELAILNSVLGGGVSSRLFQKVREEMGLAYSIYSFYDQYLETGLFGVYSACSPAQFDHMWNAITQEMGRIIKEPPTEDEIDRAKTMGVDNLKMSFESISFRMTQMAYHKFCYDRIYTQDELIEQLTSVTADGVLELAEELFDRDNFTMLAVGPVPKENVMELAGC